jgi:hypothetical protein
VVLIAAHCVDGLKLLYGDRSDHIGALIPHIGVRKVRHGRRCTLKSGLDGCCVRVRECQPIGKQSEHLPVL